MNKTTLLNTLGLIIFIFLKGNTPLKGQDELIQFNQYGVEDGLSHRFVNAIVQDQKGFIWIGTNYGLNRFDGHEFKIYTIANKITKETNIVGIYTGFRDYLLLRYNHQNGDSYIFFDPKTEQQLSQEEVLGSLPTRLKKKPYANLHSSMNNRKATPTIAIDGNIFMLSDNPEMLYVYRSQKQVWDSIYYQLEANESIQHISSIGDYTTLQIVKSDSSNPLISNRLLVLDQSYNIHYQTPVFTKKLLTTYVAADSLYFVEETLVNKGHIAHLQIANNAPIPIDTISYIHGGLAYSTGETTYNVYFQNTEQLDVIDYKGKVVQSTKLSNLNNKEAIAQLNSVLVDSDMGIWIADFNKLPFAYLKLLKNRFQRYLHNVKKEENASLFDYQSTRGIAIYQDSILFINSAKRSYQLNLKTQDLTTIPIPITDEDYTWAWDMKLYEDELWTVTHTYCLVRYNVITKKLDFFTTNLNHKSSRLNTLHKDKTGKIWIGAESGLWYFETKDSIITPYPNSPKELAKTHYFHENDAGLWICTTSGLYLLDTKKGTFERFYEQGTGKYHLPYSNIAHIHEDKEGVFWLATKGGGLIEWNPTTYATTQYTTESAGLSHNITYGVYADAYGYLWLSSDRGIMRFDKETHIVNRFLTNDGITHEEFNTNSHYQAPDGTIYFGGLNGVTAFHPKDFVNLSTKKSRFRITSLEKRLASSGDYIKAPLAEDSTKNIVIQPSENAFILKFALLDYVNPKYNRYAYKIEGLDQQWTYITQPILRVNQLPYGNYKLLLKAQGSSGNWVNYTDTITVQVLKPFYLQWWFRGLILLIIVGIIYLIFRWRIAQVEQRRQHLEEVVVERTAQIQEQAEELKAMDKVKSRFFANISHELRTPLTLILGPLSYTLDDPIITEHKEIEQQLMTMQKNGRNLLQLVEEILDLSKLEANKLELNEEPTPIVQFVERIFAIFEPQFQNQQLDYKLNVQLNDKNLHVLLDRNKVEKVINNFLSNAMKFTPDLGEISLLLTEYKQQLIFRVIDTGKGVHPKDLPYIFDRFYQSKQADAVAYGGTGIGLALVKEFAELMQGKAYAQSTVGTGSQFFFEIPLKVVSATKFVGNIDLEENEELEFIHEIGTDFTILIVEDNQDMRDFVVTLLQKRYKVLTAQNGVEGLEVLAKHREEIHLVISDVMMPKMDGLTMLKHIKSNDRGRGLPVIMLTALAAERDKLSALTMGVDDYLTKPFSVQELLVRVQNLLYNYQQRQQWQDEPSSITTLPSQSKKIISPQISEEDQVWIKEVEQIVSNNLSNSQFTVPQLYLTMNTSESTFRRRLQKIMGMTANKYIQEMRLQKARELLERKKYNSIQQVCIEIGISTPKYLSKQFIKRFGK